MRLLVLVLALAALPLSARAEEKRCPKTVAVGGAVTEIIYALGKQECLVGADTTSTWPPEAKNLPAVGYQRMLSAEGILSLRPEIVIHTAQAGPPAALKQIDGAGIERLALDDTPDLESVADKIRRIAAVYDVPDRGAALIESMEAERGALDAALTRRKDRPKILFLMMHGGGAPMAGGKDTAADAMVRLAGAENTATFEGYKPLSPEAAAALNPDIIVTTAESLAQLGGIDGLLKTPGLALTKAGKGKHVVAMDALLMLGFGPRTIQAARELSDRLRGESS